MPVPDQSEPPVLGDHNGFEIYPMPFFASMDTSNVTALVQWYQDALGFGVMFKGPEMNGQPVIVHLRRLKYQDVLVRLAAPGAEIRETSGLSLTFQSGEDVDGLAARAMATPVFGKTRVAPPVDTPWNTRQLDVTDPDGRALAFSQPRFDPELTRRLQAMFDKDKE